MVRFQVRVLKIWTRVGIIYTVGLEYYITGASMRKTTEFHNRKPWNFDDYDSDGESQIKHSGRDAKMKVFSLSTDLLTFQQQKKTQVRH